MNHNWNVNTIEVQLILKENKIRSASKMYNMDHSDNSSGLWKGCFTGTYVLDHGTINGDQTVMEASIAGKAVYHFETGKVVYE